MLRLAKVPSKLIQQLMELIIQIMPISVIEPVTIVTTFAIGSLCWPMGGGHCKYNQSFTVSVNVSPFTFNIKMYRCAFSSICIEHVHLAALV